MKAIIRVMLKPDVLDPQGLALGKALHRMGYKEVESARVGKSIELNLQNLTKVEAEKKVKDMTEKLLSNPVIETAQYEFRD